jgi:hypothetical protein
MEYINIGISYVLHPDYPLGIFNYFLLQDKFEVPKGVIRSRKSKKDRQYKVIIQCTTPDGLLHFCVIQPSIL